VAPVIEGKMFLSEDGEGIVLRVRREGNVARQEARNLARGKPSSAEELKLGQRLVVWELGDTSRWEEESFKHSNAK